MEVVVNELTEVESVVVNLVVNELDPGVLFGVLVLDFAEGMIIVVGNGPSVVILLDFSVTWIQIPYFLN
jgi:hypothetical protein